MKRSSLRSRALRSRALRVCSALLVTAPLVAVPFLTACDGGPAADLVIEPLPEVSPTLPSVPTIPPPPFPLQYPDTSYSVFGLRRRLETTIDHDVTVTGYIVEIYAPPECPEGRTCPPPTAPNLWIADARDIPADGNRLQLVGYATSQQAIDDVMEDLRRGREQPPESESGQIPIPTDFLVGNKIKVTGRFARVSGAGFNNSQGLMEYRSHETLEAVTPPEEPRGR
ncbi:MAG: hypothetical protein J0L92_30405 [Deltaproteobacteria bacterium]|nr:hypothetical protein [Deltaproteobacteria bacterium]